MNGTWAAITTALLVLAAVGAEVHLLRRLVREWREGLDMSRRAWRFRAASALERRPPQVPIAHGRRQWFAAAAALVAAALTPGVATAQNQPPEPAPAPTPTPTTTTAGQPTTAADPAKPADGGTPAEPPAPERRAFPSPWSSPPFPSSEYLGPTIGVPNSTPDYALMKLYPETEFGRWLKDNRIDIYGWVNGSFNWSTSKNSNLPNVYDIVPNRVELNQAVLRVERNPDTVQTDHVDWGFRVTNLYGTDYRFTVAKGWFDTQLLNHNDLYGYDMPELYALLYIPNVAEGMVLKVGRFISPPDIEAQLAPDNYLFSHSTMFSIDPYTFTGVLAQIKLDNNWSIEVGAHGGSDMAPWCNSAALNGHFMARWVSDDNNDSIWAGVNSVGDGKYRNGHDNLQQVVGTWSHRFSENVHMATEAYYMWQFDALKGGNVNNGPVRSFGGGGGPGPLLPGLSDSVGVVNYFQIGLTKDDYISIRTDFLADFQGQRTGFENYYWSETVGWSHALAPWAMIRPEIKYERGFNNKAYDLGAKWDQLKFGVDLTLRF